MKYWLTEEYDDLPIGTCVDGEQNGEEVIGTVSMDCCTFEVQVPASVSTTVDPLGYIADLGRYLDIHRNKRKTTLYLQNHV